MKRIDNRADFVAFARNMGVRPDWHEPDEQDLTARVEGTPFDFDNAGFWPTDPRDHTAELHVIFSERDESLDGSPMTGRDLACVNLATLCAWASGYEE